MRQKRVSSLHDSFTVTLEGDTRVYIDGCRSILKYETDKIAIRLSRRTLWVCGSALRLSAFSQCELCITGNITSVYLEGTP